MSRYPLGTTLVTEGSFVQGKDYFSYHLPALGVSFNRSERTPLEPCAVDAAETSLPPLADREATRDSSMAQRSGDDELADRLGEIMLDPVSAGEPKPSIGPAGLIHKVRNVTPGYAANESIPTS